MQVLPICTTADENTRHGTSFSARDELAMRKKKVRKEQGESAIALVKWG